MEADFSRERLAPVIKDELVSYLGSVSCSGECNLAVCMQDRHHTIFGSDLTEAEKLLKSHPDFILYSVCRDRHQTLHKQFDRSEPLSDEFVIGYLLASPVNMSTTRKKKLRRLQNG